MAVNAQDAEVVFKKSTKFNLLTPNHKLATYGIDDPLIEGVACHFTVPEKGGVKGVLGLAEELSDASLACRQVGPVKFKEKFEQGDEMFTQRRSIFFKKMRIFLNFFAPLGGVVRSHEYHFSSYLILTLNSINASKRS